MSFVSVLRKFGQKRRRFHAFACWGVILAMGGCAVGPNYHRPTTNAPGSFRNDQGTATNSLGELPWWQVFHDETLQDLIRTALTNNYDLRIAVARIEQSRAIARETRAQFFPQLNYAALAGKGKNVGAGNAPSPTGVTAGVVAVDANASWEIDLWGRIRRLNESARAQLFATEEARHDLMTSVIAQVAQEYFQLLAEEAQLEVAKKATNSFGQSLRIFSQRLQGGVASKLETSSAEALMHSTAANIPEIERQIVMTEDRLSVLLGQNPDRILHGNSTLEKQTPPDVPAGLPSALVTRRPDIREAEQQLHSANAQVGVAEADFFPQLNLTGLLGQVSPELSAFTSGGATAWGIAGNLAGPIFHGGQLRAQFRQAQAVREQFLLQYQNTVLHAFQEVSDSLISKEKLAVEQAEQASAVNAYEVALDMAMKRYQSGNASYFEVLQQQQQLFPSQTALIQTQLNQLVAVIQLYRALGGGWQN